MCVFQLGLAAENAALQEDKGRLVCVFFDFVGVGCGHNDDV